MENIELTPRLAAKLYNYVCELMDTAEGDEFAQLLKLAKQLDFQIENAKELCDECGQEHVLEVL